jgi:glycosyltransferase involved in cell wall biosynthesis
MRIVHLINTLDPAHGGPPLVAASLASALAGFGHDVTLASYHTPGREEAILMMLRAVPGIDRVRMEYLPSRTRAERLLGLQARRLLRPIVERCDVMHMHGVWEVLLKVAAGLARRAQRPYIIRPCGVLDPYSLRQKALKKRAALLLGCRRMLNGAAFLHTLNADEARLIEPLRLRCPIRVIPNGVFPDAFRDLPKPGLFRARHRDMLGDAPFVLFLSRLHHKKGLDFLADAFAVVAREMPDVRLVVVGPDEGARDSFIAQVKSLGVADRVLLTGPLYGSEKISAIVDAACFCLPSRQEGFSVAITEALACGRPVVISRECHFPEVEQAGAGEVVPLDAQRLGRALLVVVRDPERAARMGEAGRRLILDQYIWPAIATRLTNEYTEAIARVSAPVEHGVDANR